MSLGTPEMIVIFVLVLLLFGPKRLPDLARGLGKGLREFKKATGEIQNQLNILGDDDDEPSWRSRRDAAHARDTDQRDSAQRNTDDVAIPSDTPLSSASHATTNNDTKSADDLSAR